MKDEVWREHLLHLLRGHGAHQEYEELLAEFPVTLVGGRLPDTSHTPWRLLEHLRIAQWDIVEFARDPDHVSPEFPSGYWPEMDVPPAAAAWSESVAAFCRDLRTMQELVSDPATDLAARIPHGTGQTVLREALLLADHNAYHMGQLMLLRRLLEAKGNAS